VNDALSFGEKEVALKDLRAGAIFVTRDGIYAVKTEHHFLNGISVCVSLANGEYAQFAGGNLEPVREVRIAE
jgi:hypothetical protein